MSEITLALFLDLDETLVSAEYVGNVSSDVHSDDVDFYVNFEDYGKYAVTLRDGIFEFLEWASEVADLFIFSAGAPEYVSGIVAEGELYCDIRQSYSLQSNICYDEEWSWLQDYDKVMLVDNLEKDTWSSQSKLQALSLGSKRKIQDIEYYEIPEFPGCCEGDFAILKMHIQKMLGIPI